MIDASIAESLVRGGLARYVKATDSADKGVEKKRPPKKSAKE